MSNFVDAGTPIMGDTVYFLLADGPNAGLPRAAKVVRVYPIEGNPHQGGASEAWNLDLFVYNAPDDGVAPHVEVKVPMTEVGAFLPRTWNYVGLGKPGFAQTPNPAPVDQNVEVNE